MFSRQQAPSCGTGKLRQLLAATAGVCAAGEARALEFLGSELTQAGFSMILFSLLVVLVALLCLYWRQRRLSRLLHSEARTDDLTGIANRRHFFELLENHVALAERHDLSLTLICLDLDFFKRINDGAGHAAGDKVLCKVATILGDELRQEDIVARLGGDEFAVQLVMTDEDTASEIAERLRYRIENTTFEEIDEEVRISCSMGLASHHRGGSPQTLYQEADAAMYLAKRNGGNRVSRNGDKMGGGDARSFPAA